MTKIFYNVATGAAAVFDDDADVADWPDFTDVAEAASEDDIRQERDSLIAKTDWWATSDRTITAEQTAYRQALRDITGQAGFPANVTWPTKP
tara:strand:+ start:184 stop:459 length:276 start_codon:yes stop_codon:yes gene_type:complete